MKRLATFPVAEVTLVVSGHPAPLDLPPELQKKPLCMPGLPRGSQSGTQSHSHPKNVEGEFSFSFHD